MTCRQCGKELVARLHSYTTIVPTGFCDLKCKGRYVAATREFSTNNPRSVDWLPKVNRWGGWAGISGEVDLALVGEQDQFYGVIRRVLLAAKIKPERCYYTNSQKGAGQVDDLAGELWVVQPSRIVALGDLAHEKLWAVGLSHWHLPHPARWLTERRGEYIEALKEIAK